MIVCSTQDVQVQLRRADAPPLAAVHFIKSRLLLDTYSDTSMDIDLVSQVSHLLILLIETFVFFNKIAHKIDFFKLFFSLPPIKNQKIEIATVSAVNIAIVLSHIYVIW